MSRWATVLGVGVLALAGCGGGHANSSTTSPTVVFRLHGTVTRGPAQPVCRQGVPCSDPAAGVTLRFLHHGRLAAHADVGKNGTYSVRLAPGMYTVLTAPESTIGAGVQPDTVRVSAGPTRRLDFVIDTGIR